LTTYSKVTLKDENENGMKSDSSDHLKERVSPCSDIELDLGA